MKFTCFIDASSYVNLCHDNCYLNNQTLLDLLQKEVAIRFSGEVNREITRHYTELMPSSDKRASNMYALGKKTFGTYREYEERLFDRVSEATEKNKGEKHNFIALLDQYQNKKTKGLIFLTDDDKAISGVLSGVIGCFPVFQLWSSFDAVLFLYMSNKHFVFNFAEDAIKNINAEIAKGNLPNTSPEKVEHRLKTMTSYINKLSRISKLKAK